MLYSEIINIEHVKYKMGNSQDNVVTNMNIIVLDPDKTNYIENLFETLAPIEISSNSIIKKQFPSYFSLLPPTDPIIDDLNWTFSFINDIDEKEIESTINYIISNHTNNVIVIIANKEKTEEYLNILYNKIDKEIFIILIKQYVDSYRNSEMYALTNSLGDTHNIKIQLQKESEQLKLNLMQAYSYYTEIGDTSNLMFLHKDILQINSFGIIIVGPKNIGKSRFINLSLGELRAKVGLGGTTKVTGYLHSKYPIYYYDTPGINGKDQIEFDKIITVIKDNINIKCVLYFSDTIPNPNELQFFNKINSLRKEIIFIHQNEINENDFQDMNENNCFKIIEIDLSSFDGLNKLYDELFHCYQSKLLHFNNKLISEKNILFNNSIKNGNLDIFDDKFEKCFWILYHYLCNAINSHEFINIDNKSILKFIKVNHKFLQYVINMLYEIFLKGGEKYENEKLIDIILEIISPQLHDEEKNFDSFI